MAELAAGAVSSLLGVIRNEALLLGRVGSDVQFIKEEMESMNSFLAHLARTSPAGGEHDEQVRTWMTQVRVLAHDCNNCLDLYLYRGNPDIHRARGGVWSCLWWAPWFVRKMVAQHQAATQLRELKDRARDVGERRLRYGVEVPAKAKAAAAAGLPSPPLPGHPSSSSSSTSQPAVGGGADGAAGDDEDDEDEEEDPAGRRRAGLHVEPRALEDYFQERLLQWMESIWRSSSAKKPSIAVVARARVHADAIAQEASAAAEHFAGSNGVSVRCVVVDTNEAREFYGQPIYHWEILCYILWSLKPDEEKKGERIKAKAWRERYDIASGIREKIRGMRLGGKIDKIRGQIGGVMAEVKQEAGSLMEQLEPLGVLCLALHQLSKPPDIQQQKATTVEADTGDHKEKSSDTAEQPAPSSPPETTKERHKLSEEAKNALISPDIKETAEKLKEFMEKDDKGGGGSAISLDLTVYETILEQVFPAPKQNKGKQQDGSVMASTTPRIPSHSNNNNTAAATSIASAGDESQIEKIVHKVTLEIIHGFLEDTVKKLAAGKPTQGQTSEATTETEEKIQEIRWKIEDYMLAKGITDKIEKELSNKESIIIIKDDKYLPDWKKISTDLSMLNYLVRGAVIVTTKKTEEAKQYCYAQGNDDGPISYSLASLYHEWVLAHTSQPMNEDTGKRSQVFRGILDKCEPHEFCMKILAHALYANPRRSIDELQKLENTLVPETELGANAKKMFKFSYGNLPKEYKSCLLYLAIFPRGHTIRRSTIVGRWVAEGLIAKEDWPSSVRRAERCFDSLADRWLVQPVHFSAAGKVKSCMVDDPVHAFITKIAKKQHILETRLSHRLARHFSIFNDVRLRGSDGIDKFLENLCVSSRFLHLKVLDLEGSCCFLEKLHYLREICRKISLLKYLGLRDTDITQLPVEINRLHELEVLDIRETEVLPRATKHIILLKLRRLLYSCRKSPVPYTSTDDDMKSSPSVRIPDKIGKMVNMETLSSVKASESGKELKDIGQLSELRKPGVVIKDKDAHLSNLLEAISDLHECLQSLSITLTRAATGEPCSASNAELPKEIASKLVDKPKALESLTINGTTEQGQILPLLLGGVDNQFLTKVTLSKTLLNQEALEVLAVLPMLLCVRLREKAYTGGSLTLKKGFKKLNSFIVEGSNMDGIKFEEEAVPELKKIVLSSYGINELSGVKNLPKLEELVLSNSNKLVSSFANAKRIARVTLRDHRLLLEESQVEILANKALNIHSLVLLGSSSDKAELTFPKGFPDLNFVTVECPGITSIHFSNGSAPKLKKIIWSITEMKSLSGIENLPKLKEIEIKGEVPDKVEEAIKEAIKKHKNEAQTIFTHNKPEKKQAMENKEGDDHSGRAPRFWKHWR